MGRFCRCRKKDRPRVIYHDHYECTIYRSVYCGKCKKVINIEQYSTWPKNHGEYVAFEFREGKKIVQYCMRVNGVELVNREEKYNQK